MEWEGKGVVRESVDHTQGKCLCKDGPKPGKDGNMGKSSNHRLSRGLNLPNVRLGIFRALPMIRPQDSVLGRTDGPDLVETI